MRSFIKTPLLTLLLIAWGAAAYAGPGSGTMTIAPLADVGAGVEGTWTFVYTAVDTFQNGEVHLTIPAGWTAPQNSSGLSEGYVRVEAPTTDLHLVLHAPGSLRFRLRLASDAAAAPKHVRVTVTRLDGPYQGTQRQDVV